MQNTWTRIMFRCGCECVYELAKWRAQHSINILSAPASQLHGKLWGPMATFPAVRPDGRRRRCRLHSLDFDEFANAMTLDAATTVAMAGNNYAFTGTGNVGIGTGTPSAQLELYDTSPEFRLTDAASSYSRLTRTSASNTLALYNSAASAGGAAYAMSTDGISQWNRVRTGGRYRAQCEMG